MIDHLEKLFPPTFSSEDLKKKKKKNALNLHHWLFKRGKSETAATNFIFYFFLIGKPQCMCTHFLLGLERYSVLIVVVKRSSKQGFPTTLKGSLSAHDRKGGGTMAFLLL